MFSLIWLGTHKKKLALIGAVLLLLSGTAWALGTGLTTVEPKTVKVVKEAVGFSQGKIVYQLKAHVNDTESRDWIFGWPKVPGKEMGQTKEVITLDQLNFEKKTPLFWLDKETDNPKDKNTMVSIVVYGSLVVKDWGKFIESYDPTEFNAELYRENPSAPKFSTIDYWAESVLSDSVSMALDNEVIPLLQDGIARYKYLKSFIQEENLKSKEEVGNFLKTQKPWVWIYGVENYLFALEDPQSLLYYIYSAGDAIMLDLYSVVVYENFVEQLPELLSQIEDVKNNFYLTTRPELVSEAELLLENFVSYLESRGRNLAFHEQEASLTMDLDQFLKEEADYDHTEGGLVTFYNLVSMEWQKVLLLNEKKEIEKYLQEEVIPSFLNSPQDELNVYYWQLMIEKALDSPDEEPLVVWEQTMYSLLRFPPLLERVKENVEAYLDFLASWGVDEWQIDGLSLRVEDSHIFTGQPPVDKDFYRMYQYYFGEQEK